MTQEQLSRAISLTARIKYFLQIKNKSNSSLSTNQTKGRKLKPWEYFEYQQCEEELRQLKVELPNS